MFKIFQVPKKKERTRESLPTPPEGMAWIQNPQTRDWSLVPEEDLPQEVTVDFHTGNTNKDYSTGSAFENPFGVGKEEEEEEEPYYQQEQTQAQEEHKEPPRQTEVLVQVTDFPKAIDQDQEESKSNNEEADWELLSDRNSNSNHSFSHHGIAFVSRTGSVSTKNSSLMHKRTPSSSTIDSYDLMNLGPSGKGVLGVDYVEHVILPTDTLQGICLAYKVTASRLRRANHFSGESLQLAPKKLVIPISKQAMRQGYLRVQDTDSKEYKMHAIQADCPMLGISEAKAYLELADWNLRDAIQSAREDNEWEKEVPNDQLRAGQIRVMMNVSSHPENGHLLHFSAQGAGYTKYNNNNNNNNQEEEKTNDNFTSPSLKPVDPNFVNVKSVKPEDIHSVSPTHASYGVEMQSLANNNTKCTTN